MTIGLVYRRRAVALELIRHMDIIRELDRAGFVITTENIQRARYLREEFDRLSRLLNRGIPQQRTRTGMAARRDDNASNGARGYPGRATASALS